VLAPQILTRTTDWPRLASAHPYWGQCPPKNLRANVLKLGLKFRLCTPITLGLVGVTSQKFSTRCPRIRGVNLGTAFGEGPPPKIREVKKRLKFGVISDNYRLWSRISPERIHTSNIGKVSDQLQLIKSWMKESWWTLVHKQKSYRRACWRTLNYLCVYCVSWRKFIHQVALLRAEFEPPKLSLQSDLWHRVALCWALPHISSYIYF